MEVTTHLAEDWVEDVGRCRYQEVPAAVSRSDPAPAGLGNTLGCGGERASFPAVPKWDGLMGVLQGEGHCSSKSSSIRSVMLLKAPQEYSECFLPERSASYLFIYLYGSGVGFATNCSISPVIFSTLGCQKYIQPHSKRKALFLAMLQIEIAFFHRFP